MPQPAAATRARFSGPVACVLHYEPRVRSSYVMSVVAIALIACAEQAQPEGTPACEHCDVTPAPTRENLLSNLHAQMDRSVVLFGQERFNVTGVNDDGTQWLATPGYVDRSDVKTVVGAHPVVLGFDMFDLFVKPESWTPTHATHAEAARHVLASGGIVSTAWHMYGCGATDSFGATGNEACLCKAANDDAFARAFLIDGKLSRMADALHAHGLADKAMIFRPLHEHNGGWFWWGAPYWNCAQYVASPKFTGAAAYQRVYRTIVSYLRDQRGLSNLLIAYSPDGYGGFKTDDAYLSGYPGDEYVDILGVDIYYGSSPAFAMQTADAKATMQRITRVALARGKVAALTEVGNRQLAFETTAAASRWYSDHLLPVVTAPGVALAYAMTWENRTSGESQFWVPYGPHPGVADFRAFATGARIGLLGEAPALDRPPSDGAPVCGRCDSDPDGDRWGWENEASCRVPSWCLVPQYAACRSCASDPDGDGFGWENERSCEVLAGCSK